MDGDGTETGVEVCLACESNGSDGCRRENLLHARVRVRQTELDRPLTMDVPGSIGPVIATQTLETIRDRKDVFIRKSSRESVFEFVLCRIRYRHCIL